MCARDLCDAPVSFWALSKQGLYRELRKLVNEDQVWKETIQQIDWIYWKHRKPIFNEFISTPATYTNETIKTL